MIKLTESPYILVATPQLQDPHFRHAVLMIVEHNDEGAVGFIVNRPEAIPLKDILSIPSLEIPDNVPAWYGGPVDTQTGLILHNQTKLFEDHERLLDGSICLSSSEEAVSCLVTHAKHASELLEGASSDSASTLRRLRADGESLYPFRFLIGYAGWGAGQLDEEMRLGGWVQLPMDKDLLFDTPWDDMWHRAISSIGIADPMHLAPVEQHYLN